MTILDALVKCRDRDLPDLLPYIRIDGRQPTIMELTDYVARERGRRRKGKPGGITPPG